MEKKPNYSDAKASIANRNKVTRRKPTRKKFVEGFPAQGAIYKDHTNRLITHLLRDERKGIEKPFKKNNINSDKFKVQSSPSIFRHICQFLILFIFFGILVMIIVSDSQTLSDVDFEDYTFSNSEISNTIITRTLSNFFRTSSSKPLSFLFSGHNDKVMNEVIGNITSILNSLSSSTYTVNELSTISIEEIALSLYINPYSIFRMNVNKLDYSSVKPLESIFDNSPIVTSSSLRIIPTKSIFILVSNFGYDSFDTIMSSSVSLTEKERQLSFAIREIIKEKWSDRLNHRISSAVPFI